MTKAYTIRQIIKKAALGSGISVEEANALINPELADLEELVRAANELTKRRFGGFITKCAIYPAKIGLCSGDCAFCAQSAHHKCSVTPVDISASDEEKIVLGAQALQRLGVERYSLVTSGEHLTEAEFGLILHMFRQLREKTKIGLCASLGSLTPDMAGKLKEAGVTRYHHNIETSRGFFPHVCSTHSYDDKINTIHIARRAGLEICCGGIIAMGETPAQRVEMAFLLKELDVNCIPINILNPIPGTRLERQKPLDPDEIFRTIAVFRLILPDTVLKFAGGREQALGEREYSGYTAGINSVLLGNYLTTSGKAFEQELKNLAAAGLK